MPSVSEKKTYFNAYWRRQPIEIADSRAVERARVVHGFLEGKGGRLLDVGCGRGLALDFFVDRGYPVTGVDISPDVIQAVRGRGHSASVLDLEKDDIAGRFDIILCLEVLQQVFDPALVLKKMSKALSENGVLIVYLPNEFHIVARLRLLLGRSHLGHFDHSHIRLFSPKRNKELFQMTGLRIKGIVHIGIAPPRHKIFSTLINYAAQIFPSLLALSSVYKLRIL